MPTFGVGESQTFHDSEISIFRFLVQTGMNFILVFPRAEPEALFCKSGKGVHENRPNLPGIDHIIYGEMTCVAIPLLKFPLPGILPLYEPGMIEANLAAGPGKGGTHSHFSYAHDEAADPKTFAQIDDRGHVGSHKAEMDLGHVLPVLHGFASSCLTAKPPDYPPGK